MICYVDFCIKFSIILNDFAISSKSSDICRVFKKFELSREIPSDKLKLKKNEVKPDFLQKNDIAAHAIFIEVILTHFQDFESIFLDFVVHFQSMF